MTDGSAHLCANMLTSGYKRRWISRLTVLTNVDLHGSQDILNNLESPGTAELEDDDLMLDVDLPEDGLHGQYTGWRLQPLITAHLSLLPLRDECFRLDGCRSLTPSVKEC